MPPWEVAVVGVHNTVQARRLPEHDTMSITSAAAMGALADAGCTPADIDGVVGPTAAQFAHLARIGPVWHARSVGIAALLDAVAAITAGLATRVLILDGAAGQYVDRGSTAPWTRPRHEFTTSFGMFTAAEFALVARRHMIEYGTTPEAMAHVAAVIRTNGHRNPEAVYHGRGPFTAADVLASRKIAEPFRLLDCATTSEGGSAVVVARADRVTETPGVPVWILAGGLDRFAEAYQVSPTLGLGGRRRADLVNGWVGRRAAESIWDRTGLRPADVDVCEFYDPFSFEIIRQFEAFGFCGPGEGDAYVRTGAIEIGGATPVTTDGGTMSFSHTGSAQMLQRVIRGAQQLRGQCGDLQVDGAELALCSASGSGAFATELVLLGKDRP